MRKNILRSLLLAILFTLAVDEVNGQVATKPLSLAEAITRVSPSVVQITYEMDQFPKETSDALGKSFLIGAAGTGFIVNEEGYVITALHVLNFLDGINGIPINGHMYPTGQKRLLIGLASPNIETEKLKVRGAFTLIPFTVVDRDPAHDLALLKPDQSLFPLGAARHVQALSVARPNEGERVAVSGYPLGKTVLITTSGAVASSWGYEWQEPTPGRSGINVPEIKDIFFVDLHLNHGNSGGPVYSVETGAAIGVADAYALEDNVMLSPLPGGKPEPAVDQNSGRAFMTNAGLGVVVPARYVVELLKKSKLKWNETILRTP
jgi:S1-C subfamily serine protease